jgi:hypothetical protein
MDANLPPTGLVRLRLSRKMAKITKSLGMQLFRRPDATSVKRIWALRPFFFGQSVRHLGQQVRAGSRRSPQVFRRGVRANTLELLCN